MVVVPYYTRPSATGIVEHFRAVAAAVDTNILVYNVPARTGRSMDARSLIELAATPGIVGVKQAVGALDEDTLQLLRQRPPGFSVLAGDDAFIVPTILMGGAGAIAAAAHVCTNAFVAMTVAALSSDVAVARALAEVLHPVVRAGYAEPNPAVWKGALAAIGEIGSSSLRAPMTAAPTDVIQVLVGTVEDANFRLADHASPRKGTHVDRRRQRRGSIRADCTLGQGLARHAVLPSRVAALSAAIAE
jgi:4-hydroxy-tetrahydrodipicolinate synthase